VGARRCVPLALETAVDFSNIAQLANEPRAVNLFEITQ
jgi:hypothetical protein